MTAASSINNKNAPYKVNDPRQKGSWIKRANWFMVYYLGICHLAALYAFTYLPYIKWQTLPWFVAMYLMSGWGITAGAHRMWSHKSYTGTDTYRFLLMIFNCMANQGTIFHWSRDHRVHHKYSDTPADPHDSGRGFFFAHMGWLLLKKDKRVFEAGTKLNYDDLWADWVVCLQEKYNPWGQFFFCFFFPAIVAKYFWNESFVAALFLCGFLRYVLVLHATWLVNSAAHFYGYTPYDPAIPPRENWFVSIWAVGEGWHNFHHAFPYDYATSEYGVMKQFNPTKGFIDLMANIGLVKERKRALGVWAKIKENREKDEVAMAEKADDASKVVAGEKAKAA